MEKLNGLKTFIGVAYTLGAVLYPALKEIVTEEEVSQLAILLNSIIGLVIIVYGRLSRIVSRLHISHYEIA